MNVESVLNCTKSVLTPEFRTTGVLHRIKKEGYVRDFQWQSMAIVGLIVGS